MTSPHLHHRTYAATVAAAGAAGLLALLTACGSGSTAAPAAAAAPTAAATTGAAGGGSASTISVEENEFTIVPSTKTVGPGTYTFDVHNAGKITHALEVTGPGVAKASVGPIDAGQTKTLTVTLRAGTYTVLCPVGNHAMLGMTTSLVVT